MVSDRQKRNWAKKVFQRLDDDGNVIESVDTAEEVEIIEPPKNRLPDPVPPVEIEDICEDADDVPEAPTEVTQRYSPTRRQLQAKLRFHKYAPTSLILQLFDTDPANTYGNGRASVSLLDYVGQVKEEEFDSWLDIPGFWPWFIADDETDADLYHAKKAAADYLLQVMNLSEESPDGGLDMKIVNTKIRVAEAILKQNQTVKVEKKTININANLNSMPKQFRKMDTVRIEQRIKQLEEHCE